MTTNTVILGAGIIGVSTAYYLAQHQPPGTIHLVEPSPALFASASGQAGGFLARDWFAPAAAALGALSFDEHERLAAAHGGAARWGYRRSTAVSYAARPGAGGGGTSGAAGQRGEDWLLAGTSRATAGVESEWRGAAVAAPPWLRRTEGDSASTIGDAAATAQLDPLRLCRFLLDECASRGVRLHHPARAVAVMTDMRDELSGVRIAGAGAGAASSTSSSASVETDVPCARLVVAAGAWSAQALAELFPGLAGEGQGVPISSLAGHSLVVRSPRWAAGAEEVVGCHAVFATGGGEGEEDEEGFSPEMFSRAGGEIWIGGLNSAAIPLPPGPAEARVEAGAIAAVRREAGRLLGAPGSRGEEGCVVDDYNDYGDDLEVVREGLCFRPVTPRGTPIVARIEDGRLGGGMKTRAGAEGGVFLAAGHGPWGISLSLGTGMVLAEMAQGRRLSADVSSLAMW